MKRNNPTIENIIIYDGLCNLCSSWVNFVFNKLQRGEFQFIPYQSVDYKILHSSLSKLPSEPQSIIFIRGGKLFYKSKAIFEISRHLKFPFNFVKYLAFIPEKQINSLYDFIARRRYYIFGKRKACFLTKAGK